MHLLKGVVELQPRGEQCGICPLDELLGAVWKHLAETQP